MHIEIDVMNEAESLMSVPSTEEMIKVIETVLNIEGLTFDCEVSMVFTDNENIRQLNYTHRQKDVSTDVLSFPQYDEVKPDTPLPPYVYLGDIVISVEKAAEQAIEFGHSYEREITYLIVHSIFHLLGYDHMNDDDKRIMRAREKEALKILGIFK